MISRSLSRTPDVPAHPRRIAELILYAPRVFRRSTVDRKSRRSGLNLNLNATGGWPARYSWRRATAGSTRKLRRAGTSAATNAAQKNRPMAALKVAGSVAGTSKRNAASSRLAARAPTCQPRYRGRREPTLDGASATRRVSRSRRAPLSSRSRDGAARRCTTPARRCRSVPGTSPCRQRPGARPCGSARTRATSIAPAPSSEHPAAKSFSRFRRTGLRPVRDRSRAWLRPKHDCGRSSRPVGCCCMEVYIWSDTSPSRRVSLKLGTMPTTLSRQPPPSRLPRGSSPGQSAAAAARLRTTTPSVPAVSESRIGRPETIGMPRVLK